MLGGNGGLVFIYFIIFYLLFINPATQEFGDHGENFIYFRGEFGGHKVRKCEDREERESYRAIHFSSEELG